ncbi:uncharacterized protein LOC126985013 [Eriocheir sinensis]|uniref:uncharacterized protein LOC126985013 n=1 Tax=Eriocheir sinensis TaxID=95602 RepID=UPI0021C5ED35|nr:uncharacterized protein LOC126985013 [Eriocheir sinensis]
MLLPRLLFAGLVMALMVEAGVTKPETHTHSPAYAPLEDAAPRGHQQEPPPFAAQNQPPSHPGLLPARPVVNRVPSSPSTGAGSTSHFPSQLGLYSEVGPRKVVNTQVRCLKTHMQVQLSFSAPFSGYIYPHQHFSECMLFRGQGAQEAYMDLKHGTCGDEENRVILRDRSYLDPVIEHRLMIQWEPDIVCEDDVSVIVRCDRPDDFNKTIEWSFATRQLRATLESAQHPGPKMWMEIQRGEGPTAPSLNNELVYIGDVLTLIFTLTDEVYWFDSNILACFAVDGGEKKSQIEWDTSKNAEVAQASRVYSGEMTVVESGCSVKPKIFSHFIKERHTRTNGDLVTLHYAFFKAFRFPTSNKVVLQCHVQVCYKICPEPPPCSESFHPRRSEEVKRRRRRQVEEVAQNGAHEVDQVDMYRSVEVVSAEESGEKRVPVAAQTEEPHDCCAHPHAAPVSTVNTVMVVLLCIMLMLVLCLAIVILRDRKSRNLPQK